MRQGVWPKMVEEGGFAAGVGRGAFESFDLMPLKHESRGSQVIELSVQHNNKLNVRLQSVTRVIV